MKISTKIFAITSLIAGLSVAILVALTIRGANDAMLSLSRQRMLDLVTQEARIFRDQVSMIRSDLVLLSESSLSIVSIGKPEDQRPAATDIQRRPLVDQVEAMMRERTTYAQIQIRLDVDGPPRMLRSWRNGKNILTAISPPTQGSTLEQFAEEHAGVRGAEVLTAWEHPFRLPKGGEMPEEPLYLHFVSPISSSEHVMIGVVTITASLDEFAAPLESRMEGIHLALTDYAGRYIYRQRADRSIPAKRLNEELPIDDQWTHWLSHNTPELVLDSVNGYWLGDFHRISLSGPIASGDDPFLVLAGFAIPSQNAGMRLLEFKRQFIFIAFAICLLVLLSTVLGSWYLGRPIEHLIEAVNRVAAGGRDVQIPKEVSHEFGELATSVMRMTEALRAAARTQEQATLGRMASMIAHDLRNALSAVKMNLIILSNHHRSYPGHLQDSCRIALGQIDYMENILQDMLDFARPEKLFVESVDLTEAVRLAEIASLQKIEAKTITLAFEPGNKTPRIQGDRTKLLQVFHNLLDNAVTACGDGGRILIDIEPLMFESRPAVQIVITDDGDGVSPAVADRIFEPFFTTRTKGTGLGLVIAKRIIEQHGGSIRLEPAIPRGTRAVIMLPLAIPDDQQATAGGGK